MSSLINQLSIVLEYQKQIKLWMRSAFMPISVCHDCKMANQTAKINTGIEWMNEAMKDGVKNFKSLKVGKMDFPLTGHALTRQ